MAYDSYSTDWHLTEEGWIQGVPSYESGPPLAPPNGRLLTVTRQVYQGSGWSAEDVTWSEVWRSDRITNGELEKLLEGYGRQPGGPGMPAAPRQRRRRARDDY